MPYAVSAVFGGRIPGVAPGIVKIFHDSYPALSALQNPSLSLVGARERFIANVNQQTGSNFSLNQAWLTPVIAGGGLLPFVLQKHLRNINPEAGHTALPQDLHYPFPSGLTAEGLAAPGAPPAEGAVWGSNGTGFMNQIIAGQQNELMAKFGFSANHFQGLRAQAPMSMRQLFNLAQKGVPEAVNLVALLAANTGAGLTAVIPEAGSQTMMGETVGKHRPLLVPVLDDTSDNYPRALTRFSVDSATLHPSFQEFLTSIGILKPGDPTSLTGLQLAQRAAELILGERRKTTTSGLPEAVYLTTQESLYTPEDLEGLVMVPEFGLFPAA